MPAITITAQDDGTFTVEESGAESMPDMPMDMPEPESMPAAEAFGTLDEALDAARMMLGGTDLGKPALMEGESDFLAGFRGARGAQEV